MCNNVESQEVQKSGRASSGFGGGKAVDPLSLFRSTTAAAAGGGGTDGVAGGRGRDDGTAGGQAPLAAIALQAVGGLGVFAPKTNAAGASGRADGRRRRGGGEEGEGDRNNVVESQEVQKSGRVSSGSKWVGTAVDPLSRLQSTAAAVPVA